THPGHWRGGAGAPNIRGYLRGSAPGQHHGGSGQPGAVPAPRQHVTRPRDLHPSRTLARWRGSAEHPGVICAAVRPASITAAAVSPALYLHRASPSPALAICTHPGHWRGGAGAPNIRGASARQCARPASRRQRSVRRCTCAVPARHPPSRSAPIPDTGAVAKYQNKVCSYEAEKKQDRGFAHAQIYAQYCAQNSAQLTQLDSIGCKRL
ncbi:hypothetical protein UNT18_004498, partial [Salmonella enterica]|nr:hypothetical protein [Salmonella enterica]